MRNLTIRAGRGAGRGVGAQWARCGLALDGAKDEHGFITCFFSALGGGFIRPKRTNQNVTFYSQESK